MNAQPTQTSHVSSLACSNGFRDCFSLTSRSLLLGGNGGNDFKLVVTEEIARVLKLHEEKGSGHHIITLTLENGTQFRRFLSRVVGRIETEGGGKKEHGPMES